MAEQAKDSTRVEIGAWVEGTVAKKSDPKSMRKVWVTGKAALAETARLSVIVTREGRESHVVTLHVDTAEQRAQARVVLTQALAGLDALEAAAKAAKAPAKAAKPPTPPTAEQRASVVAKARADKPRVSSPTPAKTGIDDLSWMDAVRA
jgi:hypothetical protein